MSTRRVFGSWNLLRKSAWGASASLTSIFLALEFFDELNYGMEGSTLPALRADLELSYAEIGLLLGLPAAIGALIEPVLMLLGDTGLRKALIVSGGLAIAGSLACAASAQSFPALLLAYLILYPASGAFVSLSQATLMDQNPGREAQMMARWTVAGSLGNLLGPLLGAAGFALALGWRWAFYLLAVLALVLAWLFWLKPIPAPKPVTLPRGPGLREEIRRLNANLMAALRNRKLLRWTGLLQLSDLLLDVFTGYIPLYASDLLGMGASQSALLLGVLMLAGLVSDAAVIPLLERVPGRRLVRLSAALTALLFFAWLLVPWSWAKILLIIAVRFSTMGWYQVLQGEAYAAAPGRSGTVNAVGSVAALGGGALAWLVGWVAAQAGLPTALWLLSLGPISLLLFVPGAGSES